MLGANTEPYQPAERKLGITRSVLEVLAQRFQLALKRYGLEKLPKAVDVSQFKLPSKPSAERS